MSRAGGDVRVAGFRPQDRAQNLEWSVATLRALSEKKKNNSSLETDLGEATARVDKYKGEAAASSSRRSSRAICSRRPKSYAALANLQSEGDAREASIKRCQADDQERRQRLRIAGDRRFVKEEHRQDSTPSEKTMRPRARSVLFIALAAALTAACGSPSSSEDSRPAPTTAARSRSDRAIDRGRSTRGRRASKTHDARRSAPRRRAREEVSMQSLPRRPERARR